MLKKTLMPLLLCSTVSLLAAPQPDNPMWQTWADTPLTREWKNLVAKEAWKNNQIGVDHEVPAPWTDVKVDGGKIQVWGRDFIFNGKALPVQMTSQKTPVLAAPVTFKALVNGKWYSSSAGTGKVVSRYPDQVIYEGKTEVAGVAINTRFIIEFDGFTWMEYNIAARPAGVKMQRLALDFPLTREVAQMFRRQTKGFSRKAVRERWGKVTGNYTMGPLTPGWATDFCLHNDEVGIDFTSEGIAGWLAKSFNRRAEWLVTDDAVTVRFNFIDNPPANKTGKTKIALGFNMMPFRPQDPQSRGRFIYSWDPSPRDYKEIVNSPAGVVRIVSSYFWGLDTLKKRGDLGDNCLPGAIPIPRDPERFMRFMKKLRTDKPGTKIVCYAVGDLHTDYDPVFIDQIKDWRGAPENLSVESVYAQLRKRRGWLRKVCGLTKDFRDYKVYCLTWWADKIGWDGYYWDNQSFTPCLNPDHKEHVNYDCHGRKTNMKPILEYREMTKRIYKAIKKKNPNAVFIGHEMPPYSPFSEMVIDGEVLRRLAGEYQYYTRFVAPEDCRSVLFNSHTDGSVKCLLPEYSGKWASSRPEAVIPTRALMTMMWMTDMNFWLQLCHGRDVRRRFIAPRGAFGIHDAEYLPYYKHKIAMVEAPDVYCTIFRKKDKALIAVSNYGQKPVKELLNINLSDLFEGTSTGHHYSLKAYDAENGKQVKMSLVPAVATSLAEIELDIPAEDFRVFEIK